MRWMYSGRVLYHCSRSVTCSLCRSGMAKPRRMRSHSSLGGSVRAMAWEDVLPGVMACSGPVGMLGVALAAAGWPTTSTGSPGMPKAVDWGLTAQPARNAVLASNARPEKHQRRALWCLNMNGMEALSGCEEGII